MSRRVFLAVPVAPEIILYREKLREVNSHITAIKWMRPYNIHLTVYFIGNIPEENFEKMVSAILPIFSLQKSFTLEFEKIAFAPSKKPKMLWVQFQKNKEFTKLSNSVHKILSAIIPENKFHYKEPVPHITLARFHSTISRKNEILIPETKLPSFHISNCELWETVKVEGRSDYRSSLSFPFSVYHDLF